MTTLEQFQQEYQALLLKYDAEIIPCGYNSALLMIGDKPYPKFNTRQLEGRDE
jgi:hypothetical protein